MQLKYVSLLKGNFNTFHY